MRLSSTRSVVDLCSGGTGRLSSVVCLRPSGTHRPVPDDPQAFGRASAAVPTARVGLPTTCHKRRICHNRTWLHLHRIGMHMALPSDIPHRREPHVRLTWCDGYSQVMVLGLELMMAGHEGAMSSDILFPSVIRHTLRQATERLRKVPHLPRERMYRRHVSYSACHRSTSRMVFRARLWIDECGMPVTPT